MLERAIVFFGEVLAREFTQLVLILSGIKQKERSDHSQTALFVFVCRV